MKLKLLVTLFDKQLRRSKQRTLKKNILMQQINDWERDSIEKIRQTANEAREILLEHTTKYISDIVVKLNKLTDQLRQSRQENDFVEIDLRQWKKQLSQFTNELSKLSTIKLKQDSKPLVTKIYVNITSVPSSMTKIGVNARWKQNGIAIVGGNKKGDGLNQLNCPWGFYVDNEEQTIYVADTGNRADQLMEPKDVIVDKESDSLIISDRRNSRVVRWPRRNGTRGETIISNVYCVGLAIDNDGYLYVPDFTKHEVRRWRIGDSFGTVVAGSNGAGNRPDQLDKPSYIFVDEDYSVYVSDENNHRVMKWEKGAKEGIVVAGDQDKGNDLSQLYKPRGIFVDELGTVYMADTDNNRTMCWYKGAKQGSVVVGENDQREQPNQLYYPMDLSLDRQGNLFVVDHDNHRIQRFDIN